MRKYILLIVTIAILGCATNAANTASSGAANVTVNEVEDDHASFPLSFRGTWKRDNISNTLTFTRNTLKASNQYYIWDFHSVHGDTYTIKPGNSDYTGKVTIKHINGNLEITGDTASKENNWNGIWKKQ